MVLHYGDMTDATNLIIDATNVQYLKAFQDDSALDLTGWQLTVGLKLDI